MKKEHIFALGFVTGGLIGYFISLARAGAGNNSGSEFYGSEYTPLLFDKKSKGFGNNSGSKFYSDTYIQTTLANKKDDCDGLMLDDTDIYNIANCADYDDFKKMGSDENVAEEDALQDTLDDIAGDE